MSASGFLTTSVDKVRERFRMTRRKLELLSILVCVASAIACDSTARNLNPPPRAAHTDQAAQALTLEIPNAIWEPRFFEALEKRTKNAGMTSLRKAVLPDGDVEMRFWYDRFEVIAGVIVRRSGTNRALVATSFEPVPQSPAACQVSMISYCERCTRPS